VTGWPLEPVIKFWLIRKPFDEIYKQIPKLQLVMLLFFLIELVMLCYSMVLGKCNFWRSIKSPLLFFFPSFVFVKGRFYCGYRCNGCGSSLESCYRIRLFIYLINKINIMIELKFYIRILNSIQLYLHKRPSCFLWWWRTRLEVITYFTLWKIEVHVAVSKSALELL
jgi:hypothetical protein